MKTTQVTEKVLNEDVQQFLAGFSEMQASMSELPIPEQRKQIKEMFVPPKDELDPVGEVEDITIQGVHGAIPLRIITPLKSKDGLMIVFFHRGGWVYGSIDESEGLCRRIANHTGFPIVQVGYRLSPENKFPVPLQDCYDAVKWVSENRGSSKKIVIMGESAGGNLAAAVSLMVRNKQGPQVVAQVLVCPVLTSELIDERYEQSPDKSLLSYENMQWFWEQYLHDPQDGEKEWASPLRATNFKNLPPTLMMTAQYDALCMEGKEYAEKLEQAGVKVVYKEYPKVIHGFMDLPVSSPEIQNALNDMKHFLDKV